MYSFLTNVTEFCLFLLYGFVFMQLFLVVLSNIIEGSTPKEIPMYFKQIHTFIIKQYIKNNSYGNFFYFGSKFVDTKKTPMDEILKMREAITLSFLFFSIFCAVTLLLNLFIFPIISTCVFTYAFFMFKLHYDTAE